MTSIALTIYGSPAPQGSHKGYVVNGRAIVTDASKYTLPWRQAVVDAARAEIEGLGSAWTPLSGPLSVAITYWLPRPKSAPKTRDVRPTKRPDLDKIQRATFDALSAAGVWQDDSLVVTSHESKFYAVGPELSRIYDAKLHRPPGARIEVVQIDP